MLASEKETLYVISIWILTFNHFVKLKHTYVFNGITNTNTWQLLEVTYSAKITTHDCISPLALLQLSTELSPVDVHYTADICGSFFGKSKRVKLLPCCGAGSASKLKASKRPDCLTDPILPYFNFTVVFLSCFFFCQCLMMSYYSSRP